MTLIDISEDLTYSDFDPNPIKREVITSKKGSGLIKRRLLWNNKISLNERIIILIRYILQSLKGKIKKPFLPDDEHLSNESLTLSVHSGTHIDAPLHYGTRCEGNPSKTIDEYPLSWFYNDGVLIDMTHKKPGEEITRQDITNYLDEIKYKLKPFDIVLIMTGWDKKRGTKEYLIHPGLNVESLKYLLACGVKIVGTDCYSLDRSLPSMINDFYKEFDNKYLWPVHYYGRTKEYLQIERLAHLEKIPKKSGFKIICFPIKINKGSAAWSRVIAYI